MVKKADITNQTPVIETSKPLISEDSLELLKELFDAMRPMSPRKPQTTRKVKRNLKMVEAILEDLKIELEVSNA